MIIILLFLPQYDFETQTYIPNSENSKNNNVKLFFSYETKGMCLQNKHILQKKTESWFSKVCQLELQRLIENGRTTVYTICTLCTTISTILHAMHYCLYNTARHAVLSLKYYTLYTVSTILHAMHYCLYNTARYALLSLQYVHSPLYMDAYTTLCRVLWIH